MSNNDIIRAWKDEEYLENLSAEQRSQLPENPAGMIEMSDKDMEVVAGGLNIGSVNEDDFGDVVISEVNAAFSSCQD